MKFLDFSRACSRRRLALLITLGDGRARRVLSDGVGDVVGVGLGDGNFLDFEVEYEGEFF